MMSEPNFFDKTILHSLTLRISHNYDFLCEPNMPLSLIKKYYQVHDSSLFNNNKNFNIPNRKTINKYN